MFLKIKKIFSITLAATLLFAQGASAQSSIGISTIHNTAFGARVDGVMAKSREKALLNARIRAAIDRVQHKEGTYEAYLKAAADNDDWKAMPYTKLTAPQLKTQLVSTAEAVGYLLKDSEEYAAYQTGRWLKYGTMFMFFMVASWGVCTYLVPFFAQAGYTVTMVIGLPMVCSADKVMAGLFWSLLLTGSVIVLTDVLKNTYDIFMARLFGWTYEEYLEDIKEKIIVPAATSEDMAALVQGKNMPDAWEDNETNHRYYVKIMYALEAITHNLLGDNPDRYEIAWLDIMALGSGYDLPQDRSRLESFVRKKNQEHAIAKANAVRNFRHDMFEGRAMLGPR